MFDPYRWLTPVLRYLNPERAHRLALSALRSGAIGLVYPADSPDATLNVKLWGMNFPNPIGVAAGFDKNAEAVDPLLELGCGFVEIGAVTPKPQAGNPPPRLFRLTEDRAVINRMGFNNDGLAVVAGRLARRRAPGRAEHPPGRAQGRAQGRVGANIGKNKDSSDAAADYAALAEGLSSKVDFLVINVSSPNTPGLRQLQDGEALVAIIRATRQARDRGQASTPPPVLLKVSPDLDWRALEELIAAARAEKIDGLVISNTTTDRPAALTSSFRDETGGLSGAPLFEPSTRMLRRAYELTDGTLPLVGVGGIFSGADAYAKIRAGASLVQLYTGLVYHGPGLIGRIKHDLKVLLRRDGFVSVVDAIGADHSAAGGGSRSL